MKDINSIQFFNPKEPMGWQKESASSHSPQALGKAGGVCRGCGNRVVVNGFCWGEGKQLEQVPSSGSGLLKDEE